MRFHRLPRSNTGLSNPGIFAGNVDLYLSARLLLQLRKLLRSCIYIVFYARENGPHAQVPNGRMTLQVILNIEGLEY